MCMKKPKTHEVAAEDTQQQEFYEGISRDLYDDYVTRFRDFETEAIAENQDEGAIAERVDQTKNDAFTAWEAGRGMTSRALSDYGVNLTDKQKETQERTYAQSQAAGVNDVQNTQRRIEDDRQIAQGNEIFNRGRQSASTALSTAGQAAGLESQRGQRNVNALNQYEQDKAQRSNKIWGTVAAVALGAVTGGVGAAALAGAGALGSG